MIIGRLGAIWGVLGVCALLLFAITRLSAYAIALFDYQLTGMQMLLLVVFVLFMLYSEGYKGFQKAFSPRVVSRAQHLIQHPNYIHVLLAPLFCMSYFAAPLRRQLSSIILTLTIVALVVFMRYLPQPWRGIVDAGVVVGLSWGLMSILFISWQAWQGKLSFPAEVE